MRGSRLLRRLLPHFIQAGLESTSRSAIVLGELPLPNQSTLQILLETLHRSLNPYEYALCSG